MTAKPKYDASMSERLYMRLTAEQKSRLQMAAHDTAGTSNFWRDAMLVMAETILQAEKTNLSAEELSSVLGERLTGFIVSAGALKGEDSEPET